MEKKIVLVGAGGHAKVVIEIIEEMGSTISFINDTTSDLSTLYGYPVMNQLPEKEVLVIIAIGNNKARKRISLEMSNTFGIAIHPNANLSKRCNIDEGSVVMAGATINSGAAIGRHCIVNTNASIDHDCKIGDFVHISPGASLAGNVTVGEGSHLGIGSSILPGISIGKWVTIGAGAAIIEDIPDYAVVVGVPGKIIKFNQE